MERPEKFWEQKVRRRKGDGKPRGCPKDGHNWGSRQGDGHSLVAE